MTADPHQPHIGLVVEGPGDALALPVLLRLRLEKLGVYDDILGKPVPCNGRGNALAPNGLEGKVAVAASRPGCRAVLVVLDGEGDPVCELGPRLRERVKSICRVRHAIALADTKFESWITASAETMQLPSLQYQAEGNPESLIRLAIGPVKYVKPVWQPRLTHRMDLDLARSRSASLDRCLTRFESLLPLAIDT